MSLWARAVRILKLFPRVIYEFFMDDGTFLAAGIAWYALLSFFPIVLIAMSVIGYMVPAGQSVEKHTLDMAGVYLPPTLIKHLRETLNGLNQDSGHLGVAGVLTLLWSGRHLFRAMELSIHRVWQIPVRRSYISGNLLSMVMVLLCGGVTCGVAIASAVFSWLEAVMATVRMPHMPYISLDQAMFWSWMHSWVITPAASLTIFLMLYLLLPSRQVPVVAALPGALLASVLLRFSSWLYVRWLAELVALNPLYVSIGSLAGLMLWLYVTAVVFLLGAEMVDIVDQEFYSQAPSKATASGRIRRRTPVRPAAVRGGVTPECQT